MKKLVHQFLNDNYKLDCKHSLIVELHASNWKHARRLDGPYELVKQINMIFLVPIKKVKWLIKSWCRGKATGFNFNKFWKLYLALTGYVKMLRSVGTSMKYKASTKLSLRFGT